MDEPFLIPVTYKGADLNFEASLTRWGYAHRFEVNVDGAIVFFERDEEGNYRAVIPPEENGNVPQAATDAILPTQKGNATPEEKGKVPPVELLQLIGQAIEDILK